MVDRARFDIILRDSFSGPAKRASGALGDVERGLRRVQRQQTSQMRASLRGFGRDMGSQGSGGFLGRFGTAAAFGGLTAGLAGVVVAGAEVASTFARVAYSAQAAYLSVASFRQDSITSLQTVLGNNAAAQRTFANALVMANQTPLDPQDVIGTFTNLAVGGFSERELAPLTAAAADIQAARGQAASDALVRVFSQMSGLGRVQRGDITMQAITAGLNAGDIFQSIARQMNLGTGAQGIRAAEQAVSRGRVNDRIAVQAFLDSVQRRYDNGGALGSFSRNQSNTLTGALSNARGAMFTLLASTDLSRTTGVQSVTRAVLALNSSLDMTSGTGRRLRGVIVSASDAVLNGLFGGITEDGIKGAMSDALDFAEGFVGVLRVGLPIARDFVVGFRAGVRPLLAGLRVLSADDAGAGMENFARAMGQVGQVMGFAAGATVVVVGGIAAISASGGRLGAMAGEWTAGILTFTTGLGDIGYNGALSIVEGFERGLLETGGRISTAVTGAFDGAVTAARDVLDWHSPSGVFMQAGSDVARGFELGVGGGADAAAAAAASGHTGCCLIGS
jgi:hypothetical protein